MVVSVRKSGSKHLTYFPHIITSISKLYSFGASFHQGPWNPTQPFVQDTDYWLGKTYYLATFFGPLKAYLMPK